MERRTLGKTNLKVSPIMLGANVFGWTVSESMAFKLLDAFFAAGGNFIDTADIYTMWVPGSRGGDSEAIIGKWMQLRCNRERIVIATKVGKPLGVGPTALRKQTILRAFDASLKRLRTDYIDLYQSHEDDLSVPLEETLSAFAFLMAAGKLRAIGASNYSPERLSQAWQLSLQGTYPRYESLHTVYNLYDRQPFETHLEKLCLQNNIRILSYFSLAGGFLSAKYVDHENLLKASRRHLMLRYFNKKGESILQALHYVAMQYQVAPATIALAWQLARPTVLAPIVSATTLTHIQAIMAAPRLKLDSESLQLLDTTCHSEDASLMF